MNAEKLAAIELKEYEEKLKRLDELEADLEKARDRIDELEADLKEAQTEREKALDDFEKAHDRIDELEDVEVERDQAKEDRDLWRDQAELVAPLAAIAYRSEPAEVDYLLRRAELTNLACDLRAEAVCRPATDEDVVRAWKGLPLTEREALFEKLERSEVL